MALCLQEGMWLVTCPRQISAWFSELRFLNLQSENQLIETLFGLLQAGIKPDVTCSAKELFGAINPGIKYVASCLLLQVLNPSVFSCSCVPSCCRQTSFTVPFTLCVRSRCCLGLQHGEICAVGEYLCYQAASKKCRVYFLEHALPRQIFPFENPNSPYLPYSNNFLVDGASPGVMHLWILASPMGCH